MSNNWWGRQNATQSCRMWHFDHFANFDKCRSEVAGDVISGVCACRLCRHGCPCNIWRVWSWRNYLTLWPAGPVSRITFVKDLIAFCSHLKKLDMTPYPTDFWGRMYVWHVGVDVCVKFGDYISSGSRDIHQWSRRMRHFRPFFELRQLQTGSRYDIISGMAVQFVGLYLFVNLVILGWSRRRRYFQPFFERRWLSTGSR